MKKFPTVIIYLCWFALSIVVSANASDQQKKGDWPLFSHDFSNSNHNPVERKLNRTSIKHLVRAWETFNDDALSEEAAPTGFVLEGALGLRFPNAVVGVTASPIILDDTIYYVDQLGTVFARDAKTGAITDPYKHWTTTLVDHDFDNLETPVLPELIYTSPVITDTHIWVVGSVYGRLHALDRSDGLELDFDPSTPEIDPYTLLSDFPFSSILADAVIVNTGPDDGNRDLYITGVNVILNDALVQGAESGVQLAIDITDPNNPTEVWRKFSIGINPETNLRYGTGVSIGSGLAVDTQRHFIYGGTGQNTSLPYDGYPDPDLAPEGYVDRGDSLYAIDYLTGEFVWHNQFHQGDIFDINSPVSTGPNRDDGPRDADVLSPPVLWTAKIKGRNHDLVGVGSKGGLYRVADRDTGMTVWQRQISKPTGLGGIQAGSAYANGTVYVAGFEGIDDGFSDEQFGVSFDTGIFPNAFFATFSPAFWADIEDTRNDDNPATGMRIKVFALDAGTGRSKWRSHGKGYVELLAGAALRHVSVANNLVYVTTTSGTLFVLDARSGRVLYSDQTVDLNDTMALGLGKPHHASMNTGVLISNGMVYTGYGAQNNPSGGIIAYKIDVKPAAQELVSNLGQQIRRLYMSYGLKQQLLNSINNSRHSVNKGNTQNAIRHLQKFARQVRKSRELVSQQHSLVKQSADLVELLGDDE